MSKPCYWDGDDDPPDHIEAEIRTIVPVMHKLAEQIADLRAVTLDGLRVKAAALLKYCQYDARVVGQVKAKRVLARQPDIASI